MKYDKNQIVEIKGVLWKIEDGLITFKSEGKKVILNETLSILWRLFDGISSIKNIIDDLYEKYKMENTKEHIEEIVELSIDQLREEKLIVLKDNDEFGGWFDYE